MPDIKCFIADLGGVATVGDLADFLEVSERTVREWARDHDVPRAGNSFAFPLKQAQMLADDLTSDDEDENDDGPDDEDDADDADGDDDDDDACDSGDE
jgi:hypothetical protein